MKPITISKTIFFLLGLGIFFSCSSDDDSGGTGSDQPQLVLTASVMETTTGEEISFEVTANGEAVSGAEIFIDGTGISGYSHVFEEVGEYQARAKKEGFKDSAPLNLNINKAQPIVYVAGHDKFYPKAWKNGVPVGLTGETSYGTANSIFISEKNIYVAGKLDSGSNYMAVYWNLPAGEEENGTLVKLTDGTHYAYANSVFVSDGDIYVAGNEKNGINIAKYWKNETPVSLTDNTWAHSIFVDNEDVYIGGVGVENSFQVARYWKNGVLVEIDTNNGSGLGAVNDILVSDGDVYLAGWEQNSGYVAKYWKNDAPINLSDATSHAEANSIFISDGDIYVAGYQENPAGIKVAQYWRNGMPVSLTNGMNNAEAKSIFVFEGDVYVCGYEENSSGKQVAKYWKNGEPVILADGTGHSLAYSIAVMRP